MVTFFQKARDTSTRGQSCKFVKKNYCHSDIQRYFFSQRVINRWNSLTQDEIDAPSINAFKNCLQKRYDWRWTFSTELAYKSFDYMSLLETSKVSPEP